MLKCVEDFWRTSEDYPLDKYLCHCYFILSGGFVFVVVIFPDELKLHLSRNLNCIEYTQLRPNLLASVEAWGLEENLQYRCHPQQKFAAILHMTYKTVPPVLIISLSQNKTKQNKWTKKHK